MSLNLAQFREKKKQQAPNFGKTAEICTKLLEDEELVPYGSAVRSYLETLKHGVSFMERDEEEVTDFGLESELKDLSGLKDRLKEKDRFTEEPVEKTLKDLFMKQKVYPPQECFDALQAVDEYYELGLNVPELQYGVEGAARKKEEEEKKRIAEEKRIADAQAAEARKPNWQKYIELHRPREGREYSDKEKKTMLAKMMVAANVHVVNQGKPADEKTPFDLSAARKYSSKLMDQWAFKHIANDPFRLESMLKKEPTELAEELQKIRRPFAEMTMEQRKDKIRELQGMLRYMDPKEGRSSKYRQMYESIEGITEEKLNSLQDCDDPKKNGESLLQNIFDSTEKYQKGKKSLRSKPDQACRFDQSVDILACLGESCPSAKNMTEGLIDRINEVRAGHDQPEYQSFSCGSNYVRGHSNATRKYEAALKAYKVKSKQGVQGLTVPKDPWAEPPKPRHVLPKNENATLLDYETYKESPESLNKFTGDSGDFVSTPQGYSTFYWGHFKDKEMPKEFGKAAIACALAAKDTPLLYSEAWKKVGCDATVYAANYEKYVNDPAVEKLAAKYMNADARKGLFPEGAEMNGQNLNADALSQEYQNLAQPNLAM